MGTTGTRRSSVTGRSDALAESGGGPRRLPSSTRRPRSPRSPSSRNACPHRRTVRRQQPSRWASAGTDQPRADQRTTCARRARCGSPPNCQRRHSRCWAGVSEGIRSIRHLLAQQRVAGFPPSPLATAVGVLRSTSLQGEISRYITCRIAIGGDTMSQSGESNPHGEHEESTERASGAGGSIPSADAHDAVTALGSPNGVDTNSLEVAYLDFVTIMLRRLARRAESSGLHLTAYSTVQFVDATSYYQRFRMHPDYRELLLAY